MTAEELAAVLALVSALVVNDRAALDIAGAYEHGDPYEWTREYGRWGQVHLALPPGDPRHWGGGVERNAPGGTATPVIVDMWTVEEGPSDLSLECDLVTDEHGKVVARFHSLHVM